MSWLDFILNVAGLLLWLNWCAIPFGAVPARAVTVLAVPRRAPPPRARFFSLLGLLALLLARAVFYWQAGPQWDWRPAIPLGPTMLHFRSDLFGRMILYSFFSFGATLGIFYLWLLLLGSVNARASDTDPVQRLVRLHLGPLARWPAAVKLLLPLVAAMLLWCLLNPFLTDIGLVPKVAFPRLLAQGAVIGLAVYLALKYLLIALFVLYLLNSYLYLGNYPFWNFVNDTVRGLLRPLRWLPLRIGWLDLAPWAGLALVILAALYGPVGLERMYH